MSQRRTSNVVPESSALGARRQAAGHGAGSLRTVAMFHSAHNLQINIADSTLTVVGGDIVHNHSVHYHYDHPPDIWGILQSIPNFRRIYQDMLSKATPGTGMWLVRGDKFRVWLEPNGNIKIFWGSGISGAGKTLLASIVIEHLEALRQSSDAEICVCYVYFRYSDHAEVTVRTILETIVMQTLERHPECQALIEQTYARHLLERTEPTEFQLMELLRELSNAMSYTFYILDALDEAPTRIQLAVVRALASLDVKLFITSRPLKTVEAHFPQAYTFPIIAQDADVELHITKGIDENAELQRLLQASPLLRDEIFSTIKKNCSGMFLHASLQLDALQDCVNANQVRRNLQCFPSRIEDVYLQTWDRILSQNAELAEIAKAVLVWVLNAPSSMTVEELERAVATSPDTCKFEPDRLVPGTTLMSLCRGLIAVDEQSRIVRLVHYTAKEVLGNLLHESYPHPHSLLAAVCMATLTECGFQDTRISSEEEFQMALEKNILLPYASEAWAFHASKSLDDDDSRVRTARFISEIKAFPAYTNYDRTRHFDILTPLHAASLYRLPLVFIKDTIEGNPNVTTVVRQQSPLIMASRSGNEELVTHLIGLSVIETNQVDTGERSALIWAALRGHTDIVKVLLAHPKTQVSLVDSNGWSALMWAVINGHTSVVRLLLMHPEIQINLPSNDGWSVLVHAAYQGQESAVKLLLAHPEVQVNLDSNDGWSALMRAAGKGHEGIVKLLLAHPKIQVNLSSNNGCSALMRAASKGREGVVKLLLMRPEIQVNLADNQGWSALMRAAHGCQKGVIKLLLTHPKVQVNLFNKDGQSALILAAKKGHEGFVKLLVMHPDVQVNLVDNDGRSALIWAACLGDKGVAKLLMMHPDVQVNLVDNNGWSALFQAASEGHDSIVKLLLAHSDAQVNLVNKDGRSAIMQAAKKGHEGALKLLLEHPNVQVNLVDKIGWSALLRAVFLGHEGIVKLLTMHPDLQVNLVAHDGWSALIWAARLGNAGVVKLLLEHPEIQVNLVEDSGCSALMLSTEEGHRGVVKLLIAHPEIQINLVDNHGWSAFIWAAREGREGILKLLLTHPEIQVDLATSHGSTALSLAAQYGHVTIVEILLTTGAFDVNASDKDGDTPLKLAAKDGHGDIIGLLLNVPCINITIRSTADGHTAMSVAEANGHRTVVQLLQEFESRNRVSASPTKISQLSLHNEDGSDSDIEEAYYDAEDGDEGGVDLRLSDV